MFVQFVNTDLQKVNIVWLKRDLRTSDHLPLFWAEEDGLPYLIIFLFEPSLYQLPDTSSRHLRFQLDSLLEMQSELQNTNHRVHCFNGEAEDVFKYLFTHVEIMHVFSYQETGIQSSWDRDKRMKKLLMA